MLSIERETYKIELQNRPTTFRSIVVKLYYKEIEEIEQPKERQQDQDQELQEQDRDKEEGLEQLVQRNLERQRQAPYCYNQFLKAFINKTLVNTVFISNKEKLDIEISRKL